MSRLMERFRRRFPPAEPQPAPVAIPAGRLPRHIDEMIGASDLRFAEATEAAAATDSHNAFAFALQRVLGRPRANLFYSPLSIRMALAVTYAGARGDTAEEIRAALRSGRTGESFHRELAALARYVGRLKDETTDIAIASSLWAQAGAPLLPSFAELALQRYCATVSAVDFRGDPEGVRSTINEWADARTNHRISELITPPSPSSMTRLILVSAVYFRSTWQDVFNPGLTSEAPFYLEDGTSVPAPLMRKTICVGFGRAPGYQAVMLPYSHRTLAMLVLLPDRRDGLRDLEAALTVEMFGEVRRLLRRMDVEVFLPRFTTAWGSDLEQPLQALGIQRAFDKEHADFSGINGRTPPDEEALFVSRAVHSARCAVNEAGTEAAAATAIELDCFGMAAERQPPPVFRADHPFLFAIVDTASGAILFLGRVMNPAREA